MILNDGMIANDENTRCIPIIGKKHTYDKFFNRWGLLLEL